MKLIVWMNGAARRHGTASRLQRSLLLQIRECHRRMTAAIVGSTLPLCAPALIFLSFFLFSLTSISIFPVGAPHPSKPPSLASFDFKMSQQPKFRRFDFMPRAQFSTQFAQTPALLFLSLPLAPPCLRCFSRRPSCIFASFVFIFPFHWAEAVEHFALQLHTLYAACSPSADGANSGLTVYC